MERREEEVVVVVCSEKASDGTAAVYGIGTGEELLCIPNCVSPPCGLACVGGRLLAASRSDRDRPFAGGAIYFWALSKPQATHRSNLIEAIGPIACSKDGMYLVGGSPSGNAYIWEVTGGTLLKSWRAHKKSVSCVAFSQDGSLVISGSEEGTVCAWSMISLLNTEDPQEAGSFPNFHIWTKHQSCITGLVTLSGGSCPILISSSLDGTCKVRELVSGRLLQTQALSTAVTAIAVDPWEQLLLSGTGDGVIYISELIGIGMQEHRITVYKDDCWVLCGHIAPISTLAFSSEGLWLVSASKDCTVGIWDAKTWHIHRRLEHGKGPISNLLVIPKSSLFTVHDNRSCLPLKVPTLAKICRPSNAADGTRTFLQSHCSKDEHAICTNFHTSRLLNEQILDLEQRRTPEAIQLMVATNIEARLQNIAMAKDLVDMNKQLRSRLIDTMRLRLCKD